MIATTVFVILTVTPIGLWERMRVNAQMETKEYSTEEQCLVVKNNFQNVLTEKIIQLSYKNANQKERHRLIEIRDSMRCSNEKSNNQAPFEIDEDIVPDNPNLIPSFPDVFVIGRYAASNKFYVKRVLYNPQEFEKIEDCAVQKERVMEQVYEEAAFFVDRKNEQVDYGKEAMRRYEATHNCVKRRPKKASDINLLPPKPLVFTKSFIFIERQSQNNKVIYFDQFDSAKQCQTALEQKLRNTYEGLKLFASDNAEAYDKNVAKQYHDIRVQGVNKRKMLLHCVPSTSINPSSLTRSIN